MNEQPGFELIVKERKLRFHGTCLEALPFCEAMCCRHQWEVKVSEGEYKSNRYRAGRFCDLTDRECDSNSDSCPHLRYILEKKADRSCVYLNEENRCSIYQDRPQACRNFSCSGGWHLGSTFPPDEKKAGEESNATLLTKMTKETFTGRLKDNRIFVLHPLMILKTLFYLPEKKKIIFVKKMAGSCDMFHTDDEFFHPDFDETKLLDLAQTFYSKKNLGDILQEFCKEHDTELEPGVLHEIVWLLDKHNIIIDSSHFTSMLSSNGSV